ncbi:MAG: two-component regulator propeller domain-containing protein [Chitinophagaceae bacterium]
MWRCNQLTTNIIVAIFLIAAGNLRAQTFTTRLYSTADGLSDNNIFTAYQDSYGYLWLGTPNGLNRFDGKVFSTYGLRQGLPSLLIDRIYEDRHHQLWIGTRAGMAALQGDSCITYPVDDRQKIKFVSGFAESPNGQLWASTDKGVYEFRNQQWNKIILFPGSGGMAVSNLIVTKQGIYISYNSRKLVFQKPGGPWQVLITADSNTAILTGIYEKNDTIYVGTHKKLQRLANGQSALLFRDSLSSKYTYCSFLDNSGRFWFGTEEDGVFMALQNGAQTNYQHLPLSFNLVSGFLEDREHNIWVAAFQGLSKYTAVPYTTYALPEFKQIGTLRNCFVTPGGSILVSGENGSLLLIKPGSLPGVMPEVIAKMRLQTPGDFIDYHISDADGHMWFTTRNGGLYGLHEGHLKNLTSIAPASNKTFRGLAYYSPTRQLFVCGDSVLFSGTDKKLDTFFSPNNHQFIPMPSRVITTEFHKSLLVQTLESGACMINSKGTILQLEEDIDLSMAFTVMATEGNKGTILWTVVAGRGIFKYEWQDDMPLRLLETITDKDGFPGNYVLAISVDQNNKIWLATTKGMVLLQKSQDNKWLRHDFEIPESCAATAFSFAKLSYGIHNDMWMNSNNKLIVFDATKTNVPNTTTTTSIEKILLFNQPVNWSLLADSVTSYRQLPVNPTLNHLQNTISIVFNGIQFNDHSLLEYSYRLIPADTTWSSPMASNIVSFNQLLPDAYRFEVRSRIRGFEWSPAAIFSFRITKPFWETWWFRVALVLAASAFLLAIFRNRLRQMKIKSDMKTQLRDLRMKALKAQMNPHFIHNALNSIQSLIINNQSSMASQYISKFARLLRQVFENSDTNLISLEKELYSLRLYVDLEKLRLNMEVNYAESLDQKLFVEEIKIPPFIFQPFVENALWHGFSSKEGEKQITLSVHGDNDWLIFEITDNGVGRLRAAASYHSFPEGHLSKALAITRQRLSDFNESPATDPIIFTDLSENGQPSGTTVTIRIKTG